MTLWLLKIIFRTPTTISLACGQRVHDARLFLGIVGQIFYDLEAIVHPRSQLGALTKIYTQACQKLPGNGESARNL